MGKTLILTVFAALFLLIAACGSDSAPTPERESADSVQGPASANAPAATAAPAPERESSDSVQGVRGAQGPASANAPTPMQRPASTNLPAATAAPAPPSRPTPAREGSGGQGQPSATTFQDYGRLPFIETEVDSVSTFSLDTDRTSYNLALSWARSGYEVEPASVRAEE